MEIEREVVCKRCRSGYTIIGEGNSFVCPKCKHKNLMAAMFVQKCARCGREYIVRGSGDYTICDCGYKNRIPMSSWVNCFRRQYNAPSSSSCRWGGGRETDYFDSDMEGAPGFNGW